MAQQHRLRFLNRRAFTAVDCLDCTDPPWHRAIEPGHSTEDLKKLHRMHQADIAERERNEAMRRRLRGEEE